MNMITESEELILNLLWRDEKLSVMQIVKALEAQGVQVKGAEMTMEATNPAEVTLSDAKKVMRLIDKLEELEDLQNVYHTADITDEIAEQLGARCGLEVRVTVPGHTQRGGSPCAYDRVFASRLGSEAGKLILKNEYGFMVGYKNREIVKVPLEDVAGKLKKVDPDSSIVKEARLLGISFGG